jgi:hypothetical protein
VKGVVLQLNPGANLVDISHDIDSQSVAQGAFVLGSAYHSFPKNTIHVAVVDPQVRTSRRIILLVAPDGCFLAPDNGLLTYVLRDSAAYVGASQNGRFLEPMDVAIPSDCVAYNLSNKGLWKTPVGSTFHGRDIFAPVAPHLSLRTSPEKVGESLNSIVCLCIPHSRREGDTLVGNVVHADAFGNLITTIDEKALAQDKVEVLLKVRRIQGVSRSYGESTDLLANVGSHDNLEISVKNGNAAIELKAKVGDEVFVEFVVS